MPIRLDPDTPASPAESRAGGRRAAADTRRAGVVGLVVLLVLGGVLSFGLQSRLIWDDIALLGPDAGALQGASLLDVMTRDFFARGESATDAHYYRPLVSASYWLGATLGSGEPFAYSVTNLALHLMACALLYALLLRSRVSIPVAAGATFLFGAMPRLTESVFWIAGRTDIMASIFVLLALLVYRGSGDAGVGRRLAAGVLIGLGLSCKEVAVAGLVALCGVELVGLWRGGGDAGLAYRAWHRVAPLWAGFALYMGVRLGVMRGLWQTSLELDPAERVALGAEALGRYALMLVDPLRPTLRIGSVFAPRDAAVMTLGVGVAILGVALLIRRIRVARETGPGAEPPLLALLVAGASLGLVLHLLPFGSDTIAADRFLYLPWAGLVLFAAPLFDGLWGVGRRTASAATLLVCAAFGVACIERAAIWDDEVLLWHDAVIHADPVDAVPHSWLGIALLERDEPAAALAHFGHALRLEGERPPQHRERVLILDLLANSSLAFSALGREDEALRAIDASLRFEPGRVDYLLRRADVQSHMLRFDEARATLAVAAGAGADPGSIAAATARLDAAQRDFAALPAAEADPVGALVQRARLFQRLDAQGSAASIWQAVLREPGVTPPVALEAARYHAFQGRPAVALALLERLDADADAGTDASERALLRAAARLRLEAAVPETILRFAHALGAEVRSGDAPLARLGPG